MSMQIGERLATLRLEDAEATTEKDGSPLGRFGALEEGRPPKQGRHEHAYICIHTYRYIYIYIHFTYVYVRTYMYFFINM